MNESFITEAQVEAALDFLRDDAKTIGAARERLIRSEHMVKVVKALEMKRYGILPVGAQEREAVASDPYLRAVNEEAMAAGDYERLRALRVAAEARIEVWRSMSANVRSMKL